MPSTSTAIGSPTRPAANRIQSSSARHRELRTVTLAQRSNVQVSFNRRLEIPVHSPNAEQEVEYKRIREADADDDVRLHISCDLFSLTNIFFLGKIHSQTRDDQKRPARTNLVPPPHVKK
jgi:hypothetical protein